MEVVSGILSLHAQRVAGSPEFLWELPLR